MMGKHMTCLAAALSLAIASGGCGKDVVIDVTLLPVGNAQGSAASGEFDLSYVVSETSCPETAFGMTLPAAQQTITTTATLVQDNGLFEMTIDPATGWPGHDMSGGMFWYGNFRIGSAYYFDTAEHILFITLADGRFVDGTDQFEGTAKIRVVGGEELDCDIEVAFLGTRAD